MAIDQASITEWVRLRTEFNVRSRECRGCSSGIAAAAGGSRFLVGGSRGRQL